METKNNLTYEQWITIVDNLIQSKIGLTHLDLSDFNSYDCWSGGASPQEAAQECIENDDLFYSLDD